IFASTTPAEGLRVGVVQTVVENRFQENLAKIERFVDHAKEHGCQLVVFPENALYWAEGSIDNATKADIEEAVERIRNHADRADICVVFGTSHRPSDSARWRNRGFVFDSDGKTLVSCWKTRDVPQSFEVNGVVCNLVICSDRTLLEYSDLPSIVQGSRVIIDISGGHGGDDGRPDLRWIRYRPWATRTGTYTIVSNPVHDNTDFMGNSPWGGGSAIVRPDGSIQASRTYEKDVMFVEEIDTTRTTTVLAERRRNHPIFGPFWEMGKRLLTKNTATPAVRITPYSSAQRDIKIAAAQMSCSRNIEDNIRTIINYIGQAAEEKADIIVFPELAVTGSLKSDILAASQPVLDKALARISNEAKAKGIYVVVGMPYDVAGARRNCALVIGDDGQVKTCYAQIVVGRRDLFAPGQGTRAMWFTVKGVHAIVTIGDDADWVEIADLAANRGMYLHFHISYEADESADDTVVRRQRNLLILRYAKYGAVVNAADPSDLPNPSSAASGASMIVSREGGHEQPAPAGVEYYLPYQTSIVKSAAAAETIVYAARRTSRRNDLDLDRHFRNRNRKSRPQQGWYDWITFGAALTTEEIQP
ncbi:MAG: nitrilase-related carbon-nitrogen hydrolase, partial [Planctomycetota bacterium]